MLRYPPATGFGVPRLDDLIALPMKTTLLTLTLLGALAAATFATPGRDLSKRRAEMKRDANKAAAVAPPQAPQTAPQSAAAPRPTAPATTSPAPQAAPAPAGPSELTREGKPPSHRFFSRLRTDASRNQSKAARDAAPQSHPVSESEQARAKKDLIYRRTWGPRANNRPR